MSEDFKVDNLFNGAGGQSASSILDALNDETDDANDKDDDDESALLDDKASDDTDTDDADDDEKDKDDEDDGTDRLTDKDDDDEKEIDLKDEDELELAKIPRRAEVKAKYPNIFKEFPALDHVFQREKAYSEVFPTLADARQAKDRSETFAQFENDLMSGDLETVIKAVKSSDEKAYNKIVGNYIQTLYKVDREAHLGLTNNILKGALKHVHDQVKDATKDSEEEQILFAVRRLNKAIYGSTEVKGPEQIAPEEKKEDPEKEKLQTERRQFEENKFKEASSAVSSRLETTIQSYVDKNIDPKNVLPPYVKTKLVEDIVSSLNKNLNGETRYKAVLAQLWMKARKDNYSSESLAKIRKAVLDKTQTILPGIIRSKKAAALKGLGIRQRSSENEKDESPKNNKEPKRDSSGKQTSTRRDTERNMPKEGESNRDFLMRD